jgi:Arc/MetJ-type ribon-helix-helix transcriptional regulator
MKKLLVYMDDDFHEDLKELAHRMKTSMSELVRYALDKTFEDDLDIIGANRAFEEYLADPSSATTLDEFLEKHGIALPSDHAKGGRQANGTLASAGQGKNRRGATKARA